MQVSPFVIFCLFIAACHALPVSQNGKYVPQLTHLGEINAPSKDRNPTIPEDGMPDTVDFGVLSKHNLSSYDDGTGSFIIDGNQLERYLDGMFQARHGLSNGYIGAELPFIGPFFEVDRNQTHRNGTMTTSWPVKSQRLANSGVAGFLNCQKDEIGTNYPELNARGCESIISGIPHFYGMHLQVAGQTLNGTVNGTDIKNFVSVLNMRDGLRTWNYTWSPKDTNVWFDIEFTALASRVRPNVAATRMRVTPRGGNVTASIIDKLDGRSAVHSSLVAKGIFPDSTNSTIYVSNHADGRPDMEAWMFSKMNISKADGSS
jgi:trehalose/maltose hydrolase-like predicted phosphorylase